MAPARRSLKERLWEKIDVRDPDDCWLWTAGTLEGYGKIGAGGDKGVPLMAHRVVYELTTGPIPTGMVIDHLCHDPDECAGGPSCSHRGCCNPAHLVVTTIRNNVLRGGKAAALNAKKRYCKRGHLLEGDNLLKVPGGRGCRLCEKAWRATHAHAVGADTHNSRKTHCAHGHEFTPDNTYVYRGSRSCKTCARARYRAKTRQRRSVPK